jgi:hypothetical protein
MTTGRWTVIGVVAVAVGSFAAASPTLALTVTRAKVAKGAVQVRGKDAAPDATITWDGEIVGQANSRGRFSFETTTLPQDCVGEVGDGTATVDAVVQLCGPLGSSGADGLSCWDLNANGTCDLSTEDSDSNGDCAAPDCQGQQGEPGICVCVCPSTTTTTTTTVTTTTIIPRLNPCGHTDSASCSRDGECPLGARCIHGGATQGWCEISAARCIYDHMCPLYPLEVCSVQGCICVPPAP